MIKTIMRLLVLIMVTKCLPALSQNNYLPGHLVNLNGDTIQGRIDYREWYQNPRSISFIPSGSEQAVVYYPLQISGFSVSDDLYVSAVVEIDEKSVKTAELSQSPEPLMKTDTVFLRSLVNGEKSLYHLRTAVDKDHFLILADGKFRTLTYSAYLTPNFERSENRNYRGQLIHYLRECPSLQRTINSADYKQSELIAVFDQYYQCTGQRIVNQVSKDETRSKLRAGVTAGITLSTLKFKSSDSFEELVEANFGSSVNPTFGGYLELFLPRNRGKLSINNTLLFTTFSFDGSHTETTQFFETVNDSELKFSYVKMQNLFRYRFLDAKALSYLNGGLSIAIAISSTNKQLRTRTSLTTGIVETDERRAVQFQDSFELGFVFGGGWQFDRVNVDLLFENSSGFSDAPRLASAVNRFYFILSYKL